MKLNVSSVLDVGRYGLVWHTSTSLAGLKPCCHFFLTTAVHRNSFVATKCVFWAQNTCITHMRRAWGAYRASTRPPSWLREKTGEVRRKGKGREREGKGEGENRFIPVPLFPHFQPFVCYTKLITMEKQ